MCGIIGYKGTENAPEVIFNGLKRLEYRGYDSWGMATANGSGLDIVKQEGELEPSKTTEESNIGIGHNRWATHGKVSKTNAHPHVSCDNRFAVVHNGIIENWKELKEELNGHEYVSGTDSEVIVHFIEEKTGTETVEEAIRDFLNSAKGSFAVGLLDSKEKNLFAFKRGSPLALGVDGEGIFFGSDIYAFSGYTNESLFLEDNEYVVIENGGFVLKDVSGKRIQRKTRKFEWKEEEIDQKEFDHHMIKEIKSIPRTIQKLRTSLHSEQRESLKELKNLIQEHEKVIFTASGTSYHASLLGVFLLQKAGVEAQTLIASEFENYERADENTLVVAVSQSGETKDVLDAIEHSKGKGATIASIVNVPHSSIERKSTVSVRVKAGQEICVAATKTFANQVALFLELARETGIDLKTSELAEKISETIEKNEGKAKKLAKELKDKKDIYIIGRGPAYPVAREIALKLKEIAYIHAEGMMGGELKHGTLALIEEGTPVISLIPENSSEIESNVKEVEARGANSIRIASSGDFEVPECTPEEFTFLATVIGFLLTYYTAKEKGLPVDKPRNLAKSVTVR